ncbi:autotransporter outer membrane beta-barrel domain-containing protein [Ahrensia kielensis]|uniref:Autotransporter outer membrane beta-barrel domain-containing protein n=1 Tax=Ahrensia kielensis TaxID=76980 RepID=A0ABU9TAB7_9HYPH
MGTGNDTFNLNDGDAVSLDQGVGNDTANIINGNIGSISQGTGNDVFSLNGGSVTGVVDQSNSGDNAYIIDGSIGSLLQGSGSDSLSILGGTVLTVIDQGSFSDILTMSDGNVAAIQQGTGDDDLQIFGGSVGTIDQSDGGDTFRMGGDADILSLDQGAGSDEVIIDDGKIDLIDQGSSDDTVTITGGSIGSLLQGSGSDNLNISDGTVLTVIDQGSFSDTLYMSGGDVAAIQQGTGDDDLQIVGGSVGAIDQSDGMDTFRMENGVEILSLDQGGDLDKAYINGGHITGLFKDGDYVEFRGGRIGAVNLTRADNTFIMDGTINPVSIDTYLSSEDGKDTYVLGAGSIGGFVNSGSGDDVITLSGTNVVGNIDTEDGDDYVFWSAGTYSNLNMGDGSDIAIITSESFNSTQVLDGGDDTSASDGWSDYIAFQNYDFVVTGSNLVNWENVLADDSKLSFTDNSITVGGIFDGSKSTGLAAKNGGTLDLGSAMAIIGNIGTLDSNSRIIAGTESGKGIYEVFVNRADSLGGILYNFGVLDMTGAYPAAGDQIKVSGDYFGSGTLMVDVDFSSDHADTIIVGGDVKGNPTAIYVNNVSGADATGNDVLLVAVSGTTGTGDFSLLDGPISAGAFQYDLSLVDSSWYLKSTYSSQAALYEVYPHVLAQFNILPTMRQRISNRKLNTNSAEVMALENPTEAWARLSASRVDMLFDNSSTGAEFDSNKTSFQVGIDTVLSENKIGKWVVGLTAQYGQLGSKIYSSFGNGTIDASSFGLGTTVTFFGNNGFYIDGQAQYNWFESELSSSTKGKLSDDNNGSGYALSLETGAKIDIAENWSVTPQAQLTWAETYFERFRGFAGEIVSLDDSSSAKGRLGLSIDHRSLGTNRNGEATSNHFYAVANLYNVFTNDVVVDVSKSKLTSKANKWTGEIGIGGAHSWGDERFSVYGEASIASNLSHIGKNLNLSGTVGFQIPF